VATGRPSPLPPPSSGIEVIKKTRRQNRENLSLATAKQVCSPVNGWPKIVLIAKGRRIKAAGKPFSAKALANQIALACGPLRYTLTSLAIVQTAGFLTWELLQSWQNAGF